MKAKIYFTFLLFLLSLSTTFGQFQQVNMPLCDPGYLNDFYSVSTNNKILGAFTETQFDVGCFCDEYYVGICSFDQGAVVLSDLKYYWTANCYSSIYGLSARQDTIYDEIGLYCGNINTTQLFWHSNGFGNKLITLPIKHDEGLGVTSIVPTANNSYTIVENHIIADESDSIYFLRVDINNDTSYRTSNITDLDTNSSNNLFFVNDSLGYFVCTDTANVSYLKKTTDYTSSWLTVLTDSVNQFTAVYFTTPTDGYIVGTNGLILTTADGGSSWQRTIAPVWSNLNTTNVTGNLRSVSFFNSNIGYAGGDAGVLYKTIDAGQNWFQIGSTTTESIISLSPVNDSILMFKTNANKIFKNNSQIVSLKNWITKTKENALFPNPFDSYVNLNKMDGKIASVEVYNALGMNVKTILNPAMQIEVKNLQQGIYIFKIILDDGSSQNLRMIKN